MRSLEIRTQRISNNVIKQNLKLDSVFCSETVNDSAQCPEPSIQSEASSVQSPEPSVQSPVPTVQRPTLGSRAQEFWYDKLFAFFTANYCFLFVSWFFDTKSDINDSVKKAMYFRSSRLQVFCKVDVLKNFAKSTWKYAVLEPLQYCKITPPACKETPTLVFSSEFCQILRTFFTEHFQVQVTASCTLTLVSAKYAVQSTCFETDHENICSITV